MIDRMMQELFKKNTHYGAEPAEEAGHITEEEERSAAKVQMFLDNGRIWSTVVDSEDRMLTDPDDITDLVLTAARAWLLQQRPEGVRQICIVWQKKDGGELRLILDETFAEEAAPEEVRDV